MAGKRHEGTVNAQDFTVLFEPPHPKVDIVFIHGFTGDPKGTWTAKSPSKQLRGHRRIASDQYGESSTGPSIPQRKQSVFSLAARSISFRKGAPSLPSPTVLVESPSPQEAPHAGAPPGRPRRGADSATDPGENREEGQETAIGGSDGIYWPRDLVPETVPFARVLTYGYDTKIRHVLGRPVSKNTVYDHAWDFLCSLEQVRTVGDEPTRPILFVAHSLGGIVLKEALRRSRDCGVTQPAIHRVLLSVEGVIFFGTPHRGADPRSFLHRILTASAEALGANVNQNIVSSLMPNESRVRELGVEFVKMAHQFHWRVHSFQEEIGVRRLFGTKVVKDDSSCIDDPIFETKQHISANHMDMCRFHSISDPQYRKVAAALRRLLESAQETGNPLLATTPAVVPRPTPDLHSSSDSVRVQASNLQPKHDDRPGRISAEKLMGLLEFEQIDARMANLISPEANTREWFLVKPEYVNWQSVDKMDEHHGFLWIKGKPGSGKSVLMKFLFSHARGSFPGAILIPFFFNARGAHLEKSTLGLYRSILFRLVSRISGLRDVLDDLDETTAYAVERNGWQVPALKYCLRRCVEAMGPNPLVLFVDALDECDEPEVFDMVSFFEELGKSALKSGGRLHICLSSRHYPSIIIEHGYEVTLETHEEQRDDLQRYIDMKLKLKGYGQVEELKSELRHKSSGIFLWVALVVQILNKEYSGGRVRDIWGRLQEIPPGLDLLFEFILNRDDDNIDELQRCLQLVACAKTPMHFIELYFALQILRDPAETGRWGYTETAVDDLQRYIRTGQREYTETTIDDMQRYIRTCSKGMVEITGLTAQFIHESVRDFITGKHGARTSMKQLDTGEKLLGQGHETLKACCLHQLRFFGTNPAFQEDTTAPLKFPFLQYATQNLLYHANAAQGHGIDQQSFIGSFPGSVWLGLAKRWMRAEIYRGADRKIQLTSSCDTPTELMYTLALNGFHELLRIHPDLERNLNCRCPEESCQFPILAACEQNHSKAVVELAQPWCDARLDPEEVEVLLRDRNISFHFNPRDDINTHLLTSLSKLSYAPAVHAYICSREAPEEVRVSGQTGYDVLHVTGSAQVAKLLLDAGVDPNSTDGYSGATPLFKSRTAAIAECLLEHGADALWEDKHRNTPLHHMASSSWMPEAVGMLLRRGADANARNAHLDTPVMHASSEKIAKTLVEHGADPQVWNSESRTPLHQASVRENSEALVQYLLSLPTVHPNTISSSGNTPLTSALECGNLEVAWLLATSDKADPNFRDGLGRTPLMIVAASRMGNPLVEAMVALKDPPVEEKDQAGRTALSLAAARPSALEAVKALLATGHASPDSRDCNGRSPLSYAAESGSPAVVELLLNSTDAVNINSGDHLGRTPLHWAVMRRRPESIEIVRCLADRPGLDLDAQDAEGRTPVSYAAGEPGLGRAVKFLADSGRVDSDSRDSLGRTPLRYAAGRGEWVSMLVLLETGRVDPDVVDGEGRSILRHFLESAGRAPWSSSGLCAVVGALLLTKRVDVLRVAGDGESPLSYARKELGRDDTFCEVVELMESYCIVRRLEDLRRERTSSASEGWGR